nr:hypothetical protein BaRGS_004620 [Batillaria attramentaria]
MADEEEEEKADDGDEPSMDLFRAIFKNSDSESDSSSATPILTRVSDSQPTPERHQKHKHGEKDKERSRHRHKKEKKKKSKHKRDKKKKKEKKKSKRSHSEKRKAESSGSHRCGFPCHLVAHVKEIVMTTTRIPFDMTKKRKKKKKTPFDLDAALNEDGAADGSPSPAPETKAEEPEEAPAPVDEDISLDLDFGGLKKKKKKKKAFDMEEMGEALEGVDSSQTASTTESGDVGFSMDDEFSLDLGKKKKKKKKTTDARVDQGEDEQIEDNDELTFDQSDGSGTKAWSSSDRDYTYDELLSRVFDIMREKNPEMIAGDKKRFVMRPPQVLRVGTRKTSFANFADICRLLHRQPKHVLAFLLAELGTSGSVDGNNQLLIRGKYTQKQIENVLRRYIKEYVTCHTCRSRETILQKDTRLFFLQCETCGSRCSVASIKTGFQAVTGKRAAIRAKTA